MRRWSEKDANFLRELREDMKDDLASAKQTVDVIGDRRLLRFTQGHLYVKEKVIEMYTKHLAWRKENGIDLIRDEILYGGKNHPSKFPKADLILEHVKQEPIAWNGISKDGSPICVETYDFVPSEVLAIITLEDYNRFLMYVLEYRVLILEQLAEQKERAFLKDIEMRRAAGEEINDADIEPYGKLVQTLVIRDLGGIGLAHISSQGQEIIRSIISISSNNYPELMGKCFMINSPWLFNAMWYFIKSILNPRTVEKVEFLSTDYIETINETVSVENLPQIIAPGLHQDNSEPFPFDLTIFEAEVPKAAETQPLPPAPPTNAQN